MPRLPDGPAPRRPAADTASCSALVARLREEEAGLAQLLERLRSRDADPGVRRDLAEVLEDLELLAAALQRHVGAQGQARELTAERALSERGRGRHALLRASRRVRRPPGKYRDVP